MKQNGFLPGFPIQLFFFVTIPLLLIGLSSCSGSDDSVRDDSEAIVDTAAMRADVNALRSEQISLRQQLEKSRQDNRALTARIAELETQLTEARDASGGSPMKVDVVTSTTGLSSAQGNPLYERGLSFFMARKYDDAIIAFREFLNGGVPSTLEDNSHYWIGECYFAKKNYRAAIEEFTRVAGVAGTDKADDALMMLGQCYTAQGETAKARQQYERIVNEYPLSTYAPKANAKLGKR